MPMSRHDSVPLYIYCYHHCRSTRTQPHSLDCIKPSHCYIFKAIRPFLVQQKVSGQISYCSCLLQYPAVKWLKRMQQMTAVHSTLSAYLLATYSFYTDGELYGPDVRTRIANSCPQIRATECVVWFMRYTIIVQIPAIWFSTLLLCKWATLYYFCTPTNGYLYCWTNQLLRF